AGGLPPGARVPGPRRRRRARLHRHQRLAGPQAALADQVRALRVRASLRGHEQLPLRDQLLPDRHAVHPLRHRGRIPIPGGRPARGLRCLRPDRDHRVHRPPIRRLCVRVAAWSAGMEI
ncbi:MAG: NADH ubiquinone oxidoreductase chain A, partial [uncultured Solirubrobacterales bacterium]